MKIPRTELLSLLQTLRPALGASKHIAVLTPCVWFDGRYASAYNGALGIRVAFATDFTGGVLGEKIIQVLRNSAAPFLSIAVGDTEMLLKLGGASITLAALPIEEWPWRPEVPETDGYLVTSELRDAIGRLLISVGPAKAKSLTSEQCGITIIQHAKTADLYSTDRMSLSWVQLDTSERKVFTHTTRLIVPTAFCHQLIRLKNRTELRFSDNAVYCLTKLVIGQRNCDVLIFSHLVEDDKPVDFEEVVKKCVTDDDERFDIPGQLQLSTDRVSALLPDELVALEIKDGYLRLSAQTPYGVGDETMKTSGRNGGRHPNVKATIDISLLRRALGHCERMKIVKDHIVMTGPDNFVQMIQRR